MTRSAARVRQDFIDFFCHRHGHELVPSAPVVPHDDPTLMFTNAGMNQFKDVFLATGTRPYKRAANTQKCIRAGGKHNDLDDVGHDTYHHTFFEMLGNWSFGDYFKKEAIAWAWELLTDVWGLDKTRLHATYFEGDQAEGLQPDLEAKELWASVTDIDPTHIHPGNKKDNFWEMGDVGPCGPCSEIHVDLTPDKSGAALVNAGDARVIEIWNLVFIQFNRVFTDHGKELVKKSMDAPSKRESTEFYSEALKHRELVPLSARHVDTGMGFERITALLQGKSSNYDTDIFTPIFAAIRDVTGAPPYAGTLPEEPRTSVRAAPETPGTTNGMQSDGPRGLKPAAPQAASQDHDQTMIDVSYRVIADHVRCLTFALTDGAVPDREGRGYVLRSILRRAVFYGRQYLNMHAPFLFRLVPTVVDVMADAFTELRTAHGGKNVDYVAELIREEEESFYRTLDWGIVLFDKAATYAGFGFIEQHKNEPSLREFLLERIGCAPEPSAGYSWAFDAEPEAIAKLDWRELNHADRPTISGEDAFMLHDTYGFPIDLTQIMAEETGLRVDFAEYERLMEEARERARGAGKAAKDTALFRHPKLHGLLRRYAPTGFVEHTDFKAECFVKQILTGPELSVRSIKIAAGEQGAIILNKSPFYAEQGGQVGDQGEIVADSGRFVVEDTQDLGNVTVHIGWCAKGFLAKFDPSLAVGLAQNKTEARAFSEPVRAVVDAKRRTPTMQNHTATHVMNWALREVLGEHVQQKGSLVDHEKTRFDFSHPKALTPEEIERVEQLVNDRIRENLAVDIDDDVPISEKPKLEKAGLRAVFEGTYPERVRVMCIGVAVKDVLGDPDNPEWRNVSIEFCGGTHLKSTGEIECFVLASEEAVAKGIRRIVGLTGPTAQLIEECGTAMVQQTEQLKAGPAQAVPEGLSALQTTLATAQIPARHRAKLRELTAELQKIAKKQQKADAADAAGVVNARIDELLAAAEKIGQTTVVVAEMPDLPIDQLKNGADRIKQTRRSAAILFGVRVGADAPPVESSAGPPSPADQSRDPDPNRDRERAATDQNRDRERAATDPNRDRERAATDQNRDHDQNRDRERAATDQNRDRERAATPAGKALILAAMSNDLIKKGLKAGDLVKHIAPIIKGGGGGPPTMAQAGGKQPEKIAEALEAGRKWIEEKL